MDYEKKYKDALERAKGTINYYKEHNRGDESAIEDLEIIFHELQESEDERIRKSLINVFSNRKKYLIDQSFGDSKVKDILAWLEKQGEQRERLINKACDVLVNCIEDFMLRRMEIWDEECKKQTLENIRKTLEE